MKIVKVANGAKVANGKRRKRRRNPNALSAVANPKRRKRRNGTLTAIAKTANPKRRRRRNPLAATVTAKTANPKRRRRRNGVAVLAKAVNGRRRGTRRRRNGIFGDSKAEVKTVLALTGGLAGTKIGGGILSPYMQTVLAYLGLQNFATPISDGVVALTVTPYVANMLGGQDAKKFARLGGLMIVALDVLEMLLPQGYLPFSFSNVNTNPIVMGANGLLAPQAIKQVAAAVATDVSNAANKAANEAVAKVSGVTNLYENGGLQYYDDMGNTLF